MPKVHLAASGEFIASQKVGSSGLHGLMRGEANLTAKASQRWTESASGLGTGRGGGASLGTALAGVGGVTAPFVREVH